MLLIKKGLIMSIQSGTKRRIKILKRKGITDKELLYSEIIKRVNIRDPRFEVKIAMFGITSMDYENIVRETINKEVL
jgi:hypothetical protein